jgi:S1-C subfamily serine protease
VSYDSPYRPTPSGSGFRLIAILMLVVLISFVVVKIMAPDFGPITNPDAAPRPVEPRGDLASFEKTTIGLYRAASPSVVHVAKSAIVRGRLSLNILEVPRGSGSGFVWSADGYVVTNEHVVRGGQRFRVTFGDQTRTAKLVGTDPNHDIAVLKVAVGPADALTPLSVGSSADLVIGQAVFAIGNPFGLDRTLTTGVISGLGREIRADNRQLIRDVIQTDAAVNPGNSGGPLLDSAGRLIGMNTAIVSPTGASAGIGFAVPVDTVNRIVPRLIRGERPPRAGLGIRLLPQEVLSYYGLKGAGILAVTPGSPADRAGLAAWSQDERTGRVVPGDVIVGLGGKEVEDYLDLLDALSGRKPGDKVRIAIRRGDETRSIEITLGELPSE